MTESTPPVVKTIHNFIQGSFQPPSSNEYMDVINPSNGAVIGKVGLSTVEDVDTAVQAAQIAFTTWSDPTQYTIKARAAILMKFHALVKQHQQELAELIVMENGKNMTEALADVAKGNETVEYACSLPQLAQGKKLQVSSGPVFCEDRRLPLGVVSSIVPFNFPFMVPMWTLPIALVMGNTVVLKPSEKVPLTMYRVCDLLKEAGVPDGVVNLVQGTKEAVQAIIAHPLVKAVTFVGSSPVANIVATSCRNINKRVTALGGAKNHLVALPDCEIEGAASDIYVSFAGCAGQRCMAASVLLLVCESEGDKAILLDNLLNKIVEKASNTEAGCGPKQMGPVIDDASHAKILRYIGQAEKDGAKVLVDGRHWKKEQGNWIGPTVLLHQQSSDVTMKEEVFGPVLSVYECSSWEEAIAIENSNPFGNAASIYTTNGAHSEWFISRFRAAMLGVNIGIPVPREPFSFGGLYGTQSKFGDMDITGDGAMEFFSNRVKVTSKWPMLRKAPRTEMNGSTSKRAKVSSAVDQANFAGSM